MDKMQKLREFIKGYGLTGIQTFPVRSLNPGETALVYNEDGVRIYHCEGWGYIDIIGLSKDEYQSLADVLDLW